MPPNFLQPSIALTPTPGALAGTGPVGGAPGAGSLHGFSVQIQLEPQWCWAAVSASVVAFYGSAAWPQCAVAQAELGFQCCGVDASTRCNVPWYLDSALSRVGCYDRMAAGVTSLADIQTEIGGGRPLGSRIAWVGGGAHFVAIGGWSVDLTGNTYLDVHDPFYGPVQVAYSSFVDGYQAPGDRWTHSYFVCHPASATAGAPAPTVNSPLSA